MVSFNIEALAREVRVAQDNASDLTPFTSQYPDFDLASAYEVAHLIHEQRQSEGAVPVGRKIGFTNPEMWDLFGVHEPVWGYVYDRTVVHTSSKHVKCKIGRFMSPKIEPEIIVHFHTQPAPTADSAELLQCIDWIALGIEIVQSPFPGWKFGAPDTVANSAMHACLLVGEHRDLRSLGPELMSTLERFSVALSCNNEVREIGRGSNVMGSPLSALSHLLGVIANQTRAPRIQGDELVTTGTLTKAFSIDPGDVWSTVFDGIELPGLTVEFER